MKENTTAQAEAPARISISTAPVYVCHKRVRALKIADIVAVNGDDDTAATLYNLVFADHRAVPLQVESRWIAEKGAIKGGYLVEYEDGYRSFSPAEAFEKGYEAEDEFLSPEEVERRNVTFNANNAMIATLRALGVPRDEVPGGSISWPIGAEAMTFQPEGKDGKRLLTHVQPCIGSTGIDTGVRAGVAIARLLGKGLPA